MVIVVKKRYSNQISPLNIICFIFRVKGKMALGNLLYHFRKYYGHKVKPIEHLNIVAYFQFLDERNPIKAYSAFDYEEKTIDIVPKDWLLNTLW